MPKFVQTPFRKILKTAVDQTPGAVGGALAAGDGETVDAWTVWNKEDWALLTAHAGVLWKHTLHALHTFHFGDVQFIFIQLEKIAMAIHSVMDGYFALLALNHTGSIVTAETRLRSAASELRLEMC